MNRSHNNYTSPSSIMRNYPVVPSHHRRGYSLNAGGLTTTTTTTSRDSDESLDLFSRTRRNSSFVPPDESQVSMKLGKLSVGSVKLPARNGLDDLLAFGDGGKNDYDWLLTPPETPLSTERSEFQSNIAAPRKSTVSRSTSITKPSRLSTSQSESTYSSRPARSSSVTRSSVSSALNNGYSSNRSSSILNTSSASVSSYIRPSSPITRSSSIPSTPSRTIASRSSTPSKSCSGPTDRSRPLQNSRPSTPSSRSQAPANLNLPATRSNSRPSTPTRRSSVSTTSATSSISISTGRGPSSGRSQTSTSRPSSPSPRVRPQQPVIPPDFPLDTPPNLRTSLPDRPVSAGRSRPGVTLSSKATTDSMTAGNLSRRPSSPVKSRGRSVESLGRGHLNSNGHNGNATEPRKSAYVSDAMRKPVKSLTTSENGGFGRTISKKSIDMAIRHMDVRNGSGSLRPLPNTSLFPQSVRSGTSRIQSSHGSGSPTSIQSNGSPSFSNNGYTLENGLYTNGSLENGKKAENDRFYGRLTEIDMYESTRYDAILLKEDLRNTTWLHSVDDKSDQISLFDNGSESLPEPFGLS